MSSSYKNNMKKLLLILVLLAETSYLKAQDVRVFEDEFRKAIENKITDSVATDLINKHYKLLMWFYDGSEDVKSYPLKEIKDEHLYKNNIDNLFADKGQHISLLACLLAASTYDTTKVADVTKVLKNSNYKNLLAAKSLIMLGHKDLDPIVKCIIANDFDETVQYLTLDFLNFEKGQLEKFACDNLLSNDTGIQYLAVKAMGQIPYKLQNEKLLRQAVINYDAVMKGWPIAVLAQYKAQNMLPVVKPYLENENLKEVSLWALTASQDLDDINYIKGLIDQKKFDKDLMKNLLNSDNEFYLESWLKMFEENIVEEDYYIDLRETKLAGNKKYLTQISKIIFNYTNELQLHSLMDFFKGMYDEDTKVFLKKCIGHPIEGVREKANQFLSAMPK